MHERVVDPQRLGLELAPLSTLRGGSPDHNADVVRQVFAGARGPIRDAVVLNAGAALAIMGEDSGADQDAFEVDLRAAMDRAEQVLDSGAAAAKLEQWREVTQSYPAGR